MQKYFSLFNNIIVFLSVVLNNNLSFKHTLMWFEDSMPVKNGNIPPNKQQSTFWSSLIVHFDTHSLRISTQYPYHLGDTNQSCVLIGQSLIWLSNPDIFLLWYIQYNPLTRTTRKSALRIAPIGFRPRHLLLSGSVPLYINIKLQTKKREPLHFWVCNKAFSLLVNIKWYNYTKIYIIKLSLLLYP